MTEPGRRTARGAVCTLGPFDGHITNADSFGQQGHADRVYFSPFVLRAQPG